jgi:hypothetical protein
MRIHNIDRIGKLYYFLKVEIVLVVVSTSELPQRLAKEASRQTIGYVANARCWGIDSAGLEHQASGA